MRRLWWISFLALAGCGIAFTAGTKPTPPPPKFQDDYAPPSREEQKNEGVPPQTSPTFGMSLVVGGNRMDSGSLPKPPIPVVMLP